MLSCVVKKSWRKCYVEIISFQEWNLLKNWIRYRYSFVIMSLGVIKIEWDDFNRWSCRLARRTIAFERHLRFHLICSNSNWSAVVITSIYNKCLNCSANFYKHFISCCFWSAHCSESNEKTFEIKQKWSICNWVFMLLQAISWFSFGILFLTSFELRLETWEEESFTERKTLVEEMGNWLGSRWRKVVKFKLLISPSWNWIERAVWKNH